MEVGVGYRGCRVKEGDPDPFVTVELSDNFKISSIYLLPCQPQFAGDSGIFPKRFSIELSNKEDFSEKTVLCTSTYETTQPASLYPIKFSANETARYVRLVVHEGHNKGISDLFALSEIVVISDGYPVSFGASVSGEGGLNVKKIWSPASLTDGRTPLGIWQNGSNPKKDIGDFALATSDNQEISWSIELDSPASIDRLVLFPHQIASSFQYSMVPDKLWIKVSNGDAKQEMKECGWFNRLQDSETLTPVVISLCENNKFGNRVTITTNAPHTIGSTKFFALSEIEIWSDGKNIAENKPVTRTFAGETTTITSLTDKFSSEKQIISVHSWLEQLCKRAALEKELAILRPARALKSSESELNAAWGSAVILGLTFLIPVFIVERRRLMSRDQLDKLRKRIASDLHDDIGSNLGSISLIARTARKDLVRLHGPGEVADDLGEVESIARESSLAMRDIVWLLERRQDSIGDLVQRMRETASRLLREINYTVECDSNKTAAKLSLDAKRHLFLFYKEAIHNVLKHSHANCVSIRLWDEDDKLALEILDNGIGIPVDEKLAPTGVAKLEDRARVLDGLLHIASSKESGTQIRLLVKRSHLTAHPTLA